MSGPVEEELEKFPGNPYEHIVKLGIKLKWNDDLSEFKPIVSRLMTLEAELSLARQEIEMLKNEKAEITALLYQERFESNPFLTRKMGMYNY